MQTIRLKSLQFQPKSKKKAWEWKSSGLYKFFSSSNIQKKFIDEADFVWPALIFWTWWSASVHFCDENFSTSTDCFIVKTDNKEIDLKYIYYYLSWNISILEQGFKWAWLKHISKEYLWELQIPLPPLSHQKQIIQKLDTLTNLINLRKLSIEKTEKLTKSIFIEMFWDPMINEKGWEVKQFIDVLKLSRWFDLPKQDRKDWIYPICASNWIIDYNNSYKVKWPWLVTWRSWSIWFAYLIKTDYWPLNTSLYSQEYNWNLIYLVYFINFYDLNRFVHWAWVPTLNRNLFHDKLISFPPISLQNKFASIVEKNEENIRKQKESLKKLEELYSGIMQESFRV